MPKKRLIIALVIFVSAIMLILVFAGRQIDSAKGVKNDKIYVATEDSGAVDVIGASSQSVIKHITLAEKGSSTMYMAHNVQVAPNGKSVWVTANAMSSDSSSSTMPDQIIVIDPVRDEITRRIDIGEDQHLAHVVLTPDNRYALAVAQEAGKIYKITTSDFRIVQSTKTATGAEPHGLRLSPNGKTAYVAMMGGKSIGKLSVQSLSFEYIPLNGKAVQTAVTPDGRYVAASVFDSKSVAIYDTAQQKLKYALLPSEAKGPLQLYPTPDSAYVYVADQGNYFSQPDNNKLYKVSLKQQEVVQTITVGTAPHGVVLSPDGKLTYVTNLVSNDVSVVNNATGKEVAKIPTGKKPNGISYWSHN